MEEGLKNILSIMNEKIDLFIKELNKKMKIFRDIINSKIFDIKNNKQFNDINDINIKKEIVKIIELEKKIKNIFINLSAFFSIK